MPSHKWAFAPRFRRHAFGWRSDTPIKRIREAIGEIRGVGRKDPALAAEGAIKFIEKLSPALEQVDSSSGALGNAVNKALQELAAIIPRANVTREERDRWLTRLWEAMLADEMPYIETLGEHWGLLCVEAELASEWADRFGADAKLMTTDYGYFKGSEARLSSLFTAGRYDDLLDVLAASSNVLWCERKWGVIALQAQGRSAEALRFAEQARDQHGGNSEIDAVCEQILLASGLREEAYRRYALQAHTRRTYLATFRSLQKTYPELEAARILKDLVDSTPGQEGKWFAAAKDAGQLEFALALVEDHPTDPRTLIRAAQKHQESEPDFAFGSALAALRWISRGHGYEITNADILQAVRLAREAGVSSGMDSQTVREKLSASVGEKNPVSAMVHQWIDTTLA